MRHPLWPGLLATLGLCTLLASLRAEEQPTSVALAGFTRPGSPSDVWTDGGVIPAALTDDEKLNAIGGTVYFMVLERHGTDPDVWSTAVEGFQKSFQAGVDFSGAASPDLDTTAKYLYLYQVVNDRKTLTPIESTSIKLDVEGKDITSWGYFAGIGFATLKPGGGAAKSEIRPVAATNLLTGGVKAAFY